MRFGHVTNTNETQCKIDWTDLEMKDFERQGDYVPANYRIKFRGFILEHSLLVGTRLVYRSASLLDNIACTCALACFSE